MLALLLFCFLVELSGGGVFESLYLSCRVHIRCLSSLLAVHVLAVLCK